MKFRQGVYKNGLDRQPENIVPPATAVTGAKAYEHWQIATNTGATAVVPHIHPGSTSEWLFSPGLLHLYPYKQLLFHPNN